MHKLMIFITLVGNLVLAKLVIAAESVTVIADEAYPPYSYKKDGKMTGIYTDILRAVFDGMPDYKVTIEGVPWKRGLKMMEESESFALYPPYKHANRPYMEYSMPILSEEVAAYCTDKVLTNPRPNWPDDYHGLTIGRNSGFEIGGDQFKEAVYAGKIKLSETKGNDKNLLKLINKRIDCYINDALSIEWELGNLKKAGKYSGSGITRGATVSGNFGYLGFTKNSGKFKFLNDFKGKYHIQLEKLKKDGKVDEIIKSYTK